MNQVQSTVFRLSIIKDYTVGRWIGNTDYLIAILANHEICVMTESYNSPRLGFFLSTVLRRIGDFKYEPIPAACE